MPFMDASAALWSLLASSSLSPSPHSSFFSLIFSSFSFFIPSSNFLTLSISFFPSLPPPYPFPSFSLSFSLSSFLLILFIPLICASERVFPIGVRSDFNHFKVASRRPVCKLVGGKEKKRRFNFLLSLVTDKMP